jgi:hypothetical protein
MLDGVFQLRNKQTPLNKLNREHAMVCRGGEVTRQ